jgi:hypothetical protein
MQGQMNEDGVEKYLPQKVSRHTRGRPRGGALDPSSQGRLPSAIRRRSTMTMKAVSTPPPSLFPCAFALSFSLFFLQELAGINVDEDEATGGRGLNRRSSSSLRGGSRVK